MLKIPRFFCEKSIKKRTFVCSQKGKFYEGTL